MTIALVCWIVHRIVGILRNGPSCMVAHPIGTPLNALNRELNHAYAFGITQRRDLPEYSSPSRAASVLHELCPGIQLVKPPEQTISREQASPGEAHGTHPQGAPLLSGVQALSRDTPRYLLSRVEVMPIR